MADSPYAPNAGKQLNKQPPVNPIRQEHWSNIS